MPYRYGKLPPRRRLSTPCLSDYLAPAAEWPAVPAEGWEAAVPADALSCLGNNEFGCCAEAGALHLIQAQSYNAGRPLNPTTAECLALYAEVTGFDPSAGPPGDNPTDRGTALEDLLLHWQRVGIRVAGQIHKIEGFAALDLASVAQQRYATYLFGGSYLGINCPQRCESDTTNWNFGPGLPIAGGHCVIRAGEGAAGGTTGSWGMWIPTSNLFYRSYLDEAYIVVTTDWLGKQGKSPTGLDLDGLLAAMRQLS